MLKWLTCYCQFTANWFAYQDYSPWFKPNCPNLELAFLPFIPWFLKLSFINNSCEPESKILIL